MDFEPLSGNHIFRKWREEREELQFWERQNPELASSWNDALDEEDRRKKAQRERERELEVNELMPEQLRMWGVPERLAAAAVGCHETPAVAAAKGFLEGEQSFLLLLGSPGAGKSVAGVYCLIQAVRPKILKAQSTTMFRHGGAFARAGEASRVSILDFDQEARWKFEDWCKERWLVVDDLGTERADDRWLARLDELIDRRYSDQLRTVITSNLDAAAFKQRYGERIADRIRHDGMIVSAGKVSLRRQELTQ